MQGNASRTTAAQAAANTAAAVQALANQMGLNASLGHQHHLHMGGSATVGHQQHQFNYMYSDGSEEEVDSEG